MIIDLFTLSREVPRCFHEGTVENYYPTLYKGTVENYPPAYLTLNKFKMEGQGRQNEIVSQLYF